MATVEVVKTEKTQLKVQLEALMETNKELHKQIEEFAFQSNNIERLVSTHESHTDDDTCAIRGGPLDIDRADHMEIPRMQRRILQLENELKRTRTRLLTSQSTLKVICM